VFFFAYRIGTILGSQPQPEKRATEMENDKENIHAIAIIRQLDFHLGRDIFCFH